MEGDCIRRRLQRPQNARTGVYMFEDISGVAKSKPNFYALISGVDKFQGFRDHKATLFSPF